MAVLFPRLKRYRSVTKMLIQPIMKGHNQSWMKKTETIYVKLQLRVQVQL